MDTPHFPAEHVAEARAARRFLDTLRQTEDLNWSVVSPSGMFVSGERTGSFRLGSDQLLVSETGESTISFGDFAIAVVDEIEAPSHERERFTVGY